MPGFISGMTYTARGQTAVATYGNGVVSTFAYNLRRGWLDSLAHTRPAGAGDALNVSFTRNGVGRIGALTAAGNGRLPGRGRSERSNRQEFRTRFPPSGRLG